MSISRINPYVAPKMLLSGVTGRLYFLLMIESIAVI